MKILHTSDWHLGTEMEGRKRYEETAALLEHIIATVQQEDIDTLLITGDVFDTHTPSNLATKQYYDFLLQLKQTTSIQNVVIIAGNHDSPSYLEAPAGLLEVLGIHVIGSIQNDHPEREVIPLQVNGVTEAIACAVPYLVSPGLPGKTQADQDAAYENYVVEHYRQIIAIAKERYPGVPIIAMGHFFAVGGKGSDDSILRGTLHSIHVEALPLEDIHYFALGHLHRPQTVNALPNVRYSGSLLKMNFTECDSEKELLLWNTAAPHDFHIHPLTRQNVPEICRMALIEGTVDDLESQMRNLAFVQKQSSDTPPLWLAIRNTGMFISELKTRLENLLGENSGIDIVICKNQALNPAMMHISKHTEKLEDITPEKLFNDFLSQQMQVNEENGISPEDAAWYRLQLKEAIQACMEDDGNQE